MFILSSCVCHATGLNIGKSGDLKIWVCITYNLLDKWIIVKILNIRTSKIITVVFLTLEPFDFAMQYSAHKMQNFKNSVGPDQTAPKGAV